FLRSNKCRLESGLIILIRRRRELLNGNSIVVFCSSSTSSATMQSQNLDWIWTESKQVMTAVVETGWNTFIFCSNHKHLSQEWSCKFFLLSLFLLYVLFSRFRVLLSGVHTIDLVLCSDIGVETYSNRDENRKVATFSEISSPQHLQKLCPQDEQAQHIIINLLDLQVCPMLSFSEKLSSIRLYLLPFIPNIALFPFFVPSLYLIISFLGDTAENIVAAFQGSQKTVLAISGTFSDAQVFLEGYFDRRDEVRSQLCLTTATITQIQVAGIGDRVCVDLCSLNETWDEVRSQLCLTTATITQIQVAGIGDRVCVDPCSLMRPGEGLLVGSFAGGLFLVHSECLESNYISSRPFRVNAEPVHAYIAVPGGKLAIFQSRKQT
ncbi:3-dehydroquinate synthase, partial [Dillenia turbinata]